MRTFPITINIYADDETEAESARRALGGFVDAMGRMGAVHDLAVDKLIDEDGVFSLRRYFNL